MPAYGLGGFPGRSQCIGDRIRSPAQLTQLDFELRAALAVIADLAINDGEPLVEVFDLELELRHGQLHCVRSLNRPGRIARWGRPALEFLLVDVLFADHPAQILEPVEDLAKAVDLRLKRCDAVGQGRVGRGGRVADILERVLAFDEIRSGRVVAFFDIGQLGSQRSEPFFGSFRDRVDRRGGCGRRLGWLCGFGERVEQRRRCLGESQAAAGDRQGQAG